MENVIDFAARQRDAAYKRRKMTEPPAAVVLLTQSGKIAAIGAPDRIRTCDLCLRRAALYPAELRVLSSE
jgi:hypothetical protein